MSEQIVALSVDKIQTFLTEAIHSHVQEKQTEDATLRGIINASYQISNGFFNSIQNMFPETDKEVLLECSGVYIFRCALSEKDLEKRLNTLFADYYRESQGQKLIQWVYFLSAGLNKIDAIQEAKKRLKLTKSWNQIVEKNKNLLFSFCQVQENADKKCNIDRNQEDFPAFTGDINALYKKKDEKQKDKNRFRIAVIKADLDRMGAMFKSIQEYSNYRNISQILNEEISLKGLHRAAFSCSPKGKTDWLFPLYIAGDDIFFAVAVEDLSCGINVCREIIQTVNQKIENSASSIKLAMSIGVEITFNRQPIRYYMDMVEAQLKNAKSKRIPEALNEFFIMKISIGNLTFFDINYEQMKKKKKLLQCKKQKRRSCKCENCRKRSEINQQLQNVPIWNYFLNDVKLLNYIKSSESGCSEELGKSHFFYTLLEDITAETIQRNPIKYINHVLYHLAPSHFGDSDLRVRKMELLLNCMLIKQLYRKDEEGTRIVLNSDTKQRFETYLRLMMFFCDARFQISLKEGMYENRYEETKKDINRYLFSQPREYLYEMCSQEINKELTDIFVMKVHRKKPHKDGYKRLVLEKSMFLRLRDTDSISIEKAAEIIEIRNPSIEEERQKIQAMNEIREKKEKLPYRLFFEKKKFCTIARKTGAWSPDFLDSLMLFYQYNEMVMEFKKMDFEQEAL